ncbi:MAG: 30S ribosomal protein S6e [Candidatus Marsarchaeota archaeon]|nr:30S ribosomal protein S6e [Candidatus Marsarchaeota archaeon]
MIVVISEPASGKSYQAEVPKDKESVFIGRKVGESIDGGALGAAGYTLSITGGSDQAGFPMRGDVSGPRRSSLLLSAGPGYIPTSSGSRRSRMVRGNTISDEIQQINLKVMTAGSKPLAEIFPPSAKKDEKKK